jgi:hypothetical protein
LATNAAPSREEPLLPIPHNLDAERAVLAAILVDNTALDPAKLIVAPSDFFDIHNRKIFTHMIALAELLYPVDYITLLDSFKRTGELQEGDLVAYLSSLPNGVPRGTNIERYARMIKEKSVLRTLAFTGQAIQDQALTGEGTPEEILERARAMLASVPDVNTAARTFHAGEEYMNAPALRCAIRNAVQLDVATIFGGLSGQAKTWILLSIAKALLKGRGTLLWGHFPVEVTAEKVIYLIPESTIGPFGHRLRLMGLMEYVESGRLQTRTLSKGPRVELDDPRILSAAKNAHVFLDTIGRWSEGDENSAGDNQRGLASDIFGLLGAGACSAVAAHHSPKGFSKETVMSLEACLRGSGDVGAMVGSAFGVRQLDPEKNIVHIECVKARDFEPPAPFQLIGRPFINNEGDFRMHRKPGDCEKLAEYLDIPGRKGRATASSRTKASNLEHLRAWLREDPELTSRQLVERFWTLKISVDDSSIRRYRKELGL